jgi:archaellum component FlaC
MSSKSASNADRIDEISQVLLQVLRDRGGTSPAAPLRDAAGLDQNQQVHYRMNEYLIPAGLAEKASEKQEQPGGRKDAIIYRLRDEGREWLRENGEDIERAVDAAKVVESLERTRDTVGDFKSRMDRLEKKYRSRTDTIARHSDRMGNNRRKISEVEDQMDSLAQTNRVEEMNERLNQVIRGHNSLSSDRVEQLEERVDELEAEVKQLRGEAAESDEIIQDESEARDEFLRADLADVREIAERADRSWWDRLLGR